MPSSRAGRGADTFAADDEYADVAVVIVTYNSADEIENLIDSLRQESTELALRVIVIDNDSTDATLAIVQRHSDVTLRASGGNLGYAGGINVGRGLIYDAGAVLILNPDLRVEPGAIVAMLGRLRSSGAGIVVPMITDAHGSTSISQRREPTPLRIVGDAIFGERFGGRPGWLSEIDYDPEAYRLAHPIEWATGAAVLISREVSDSVGDWDERFFLYSEEVDYFRRARAMGAEAWFEPTARVVHSQGGSGTSPALVALMMANRIRYADKVGSRAFVTRMRAALMLHETLRLYQPGHRHAFRAVFSRTSWGSLPHASFSRDAEASRSDPGGAIIIPAHNEAAVIERTLRALNPVLGSITVEVIVACNGCTDDTANLARGFRGVQVIDLATPSKVEALNAGDARATRWPRLYLDADIEIPAETVAALFDALGAERVLAARPPFRYDTSGASWVVRSYYRARVRMSSPETSLWGAGAYGLSAAGHARFTSFPAVTADDLWIDRQFTPAEKAVVDSPPVVVRVPRTARALLATLHRSYRGNAELGASGTGSSVRRIVVSVRGPRSALDALVYVVFAVRGRRVRMRRSIPRPETWERDESSRLVASDES